MKKGYQIIFVCLGIAFSACGFQLKTAAAERTIYIDYGKVTTKAAVGPTSINREIPLSIITAKVSGLQIKATPLTGDHTRQTIAPGQLSLSLNGKTHPLSSVGFPVSLTGESSGTEIIKPTLSLELASEVVADLYTGTLIITPWSESASGKSWGDAIRIEVAVTIKPWVKIRCNPAFITLEQTTYSETTVQNDQPLGIEISANCNWVLYCQLTSSTPELNPGFKVATTDSSRIKVLPNSGFVNNRIDLAIGAPTTLSSTNPCRVRIFVTVPNFSRLPAKEYDIPLQFAAEVYNETPF